MPFGLSGAPGVFQEMLELLCEKARHTLRKRYPHIKNFFLGAFFEDVGLGTDHREEHLKVLGVFL